MAKTILIVDNSASLRRVAAGTLEDAGYEVIEACDGKDALGKLKGQKIHLIISEVNMPNMDGITFVTEAKKVPEYKFTPVIMLITETDEDKKKAGQVAGGKALLVKPLQPAQILAAVAELVAP